MFTASGQEIPDPPSDPAARERWKLLYYCDLYGMPKEQVKTYLTEYLNTPIHAQHNERDTRED